MNKKFHNLNSSSRRVLAKQIKKNEIFGNCKQHIADDKLVQKVQLENLNGKDTLVNINRNGCWVNSVAHEVDWIQMDQNTGQKQTLCQYGNETSDSINFWQNVEQLSDYQFIKKVSDPCSSSIHT